MKKVVRLSENDLNRLVRRIISEAPFDDTDIPKLTPKDIDVLTGDEINNRMRGHQDALNKSREFEKGGSMIPMRASDIKFLLSIANDNPIHTRRLNDIQSLLDSVMRQHHTRY